MTEQNIESIYARHHWLCCLQPRNRGSTSCRQHLSSRQVWGIGRLCKQPDVWADGKHFWLEQECIQSYQEVLRKLRAVGSNRLSAEFSGAVREMLERSALRVRSYRDVGSMEEDIKATVCVYNSLRVILVLVRRIIIMVVILTACLLQIHSKNQRGSFDKNGQPRMYFGP